MREPTGSALWLLERCPGQSVLPHYASTSDAAVDGQKEHDELVSGLVSGNLPDTPRGRWLRRKRLPRYTRGEVAYAIDPRKMTARELHTEYARDYRDARPGELCLTVDLEADDGETAELKTGAAPVDAPRKNRQIQAAGVARWLAGGGVVRLRLIQAYENETGWQSCYWPDVGVLARWFRELCDILARVERARAVADPREHLRLGSHCGYCDAYQVCPAITDDCGRDTVADRYLVAIARARTAKKALEESAGKLAGREHVAEDGRVLRPTVTWRRTLDAEAAIAALPELARYATRSLTVAALHEYADGRADLGRYKKDRRRAVEQMLDDAGALRTMPTHGYEEI